MLSFIEYASDKRILELLIKERVKIALKGKMQNISSDNVVSKSGEGASLLIAEEMFLLMPPRRTWLRPSSRERVSKEGLGAKPLKQVLMRSVALTIKKHRKTPDKYRYLKHLDNFIKRIQEDIQGCAPLTFSSIRIIPKKKKKDAEGVIINRPICVFESLREKLLISLASKYLSEVFDPFLHEEVLSYRPPRTYHNSETPVLTDRDHAIGYLQNYRTEHRCGGLYVTECDIQKYFDTINHDVIRRRFKALADEVKKQHPDFEYTHVERILDAYLNSYSFYKSVVPHNVQSMQGKKNSKYECPKDELFISRGCYSEAEFEASKNKIGIPQGGALSGLISNVVLSAVDRESILAEPDSHRFFCRYGDDIMLMHPSKEMCKTLIQRYCEVLTKDKLLYHDFVSVADEDFRHKDGCKTRPALWDQKSRSPFLWGRGEAESVDWIGFLGYEIRYTGEVRMRRSSLNEKFKSIKRKYRSGAKTKIARGQFVENRKKNFDTEIAQRLNQFVDDGLVKAKSLTRNKYAMTQALKLDKYASRWIYRLLYKIAKRNERPVSEVEEWWGKAKAHGCINYRRTLPKLLEGRS